MNTTSSSSTKGKDSGNGDTQGHGETFWVLVYIFMAFAIFEVFCVALFFIYRYQKRKQKKRKQKASEKAERNQPNETHDNYGMTDMTPTTNNGPAYVDDDGLYENDKEPRYYEIQRRETLQSNSTAMVDIETTLRNTDSLSAEVSRQNSKASKSRSIIVLPKDCVIVHTTSGSQKPRVHNCGKSRPHTDTLSDDNKSLYSWESISSYYKTSTDEDYGSGSYVPTQWEDDSLYEEPDKVVPARRRRVLPSDNYGLKKLFSLQESVLSDETQDEVEEEAEHIYESPEGMTCGNPEDEMYDLPEDVIKERFKSQRGSLKHVLQSETSDEEEKPSLNLGSVFINNNENYMNSEVILRPKRQSLLFLDDIDEHEKQHNRTSVC